MNGSPQGVAVLGSTGSIGRSTLDVISLHPDRYRVVALTAHSSLDALLRQCERFRPRYAVIADDSSYSQLATELATVSPETTPLAGAEGLEQVAVLEGVDQVMAAIVGAAGLRPTLAAVRAGKRVLLANKEALVMSGGLFMAEVARSGAELLPIDSEHNAMFQCLPRQQPYRDHGVERVLLTGSGGPFRQTPLPQLSQVTPEQAVAHPNWSMGRKISVDSATMMNKGLELIEARWLFGLESDEIEVVIHPQSIIHSMVQYSDGSVLAQMGNPDMRTPIAHALAWPERIDSGVEALDLFAVARLDFEPPEWARYPALRLAMAAMDSGLGGPVALNAANEIAVEMFLQRRIEFTAIAAVVEETLQQIELPERLATVEDILMLDREARQLARQSISLRQ